MAGDYPGSGRPTRVPVLSTDDDRDLVRRADLAMYRAKGTSRGRYVVCPPTAVAAAA